MLRPGSAAVAYRLLGPLEVLSDGRAVDLGPPKQRALLAILLLHAGEVVSTERLIELVWGDDPPRTAAHSIQIYVSGLRKALEPVGADAALVTRTPGYLLQADPDSIDALRFQRFVAGAAGGGRRSGARSGPAAGGVGAWRGAPLSDFVYAEFASDSVRRLEELRLDALEQLAAADLARGRAQEALPLVEAAIRADPLRERLRELQITALYRCGRHPDALRAYQTFRRLLDDELGLSPSPSLQRLNECVLLHDPSLSPEASAAWCLSGTRIRACGRSRSGTPTISSVATASLRRCSRRWRPAPASWRSSGRRGAVSPAR